MALGEWLGPIVVVGVVLFQIYVTVRLYRTSAFERAQKMAQAKLVWLLPMLGAIIVFSVLSDEERHTRNDGSSGSQLRS